MKELNQLLGLVGSEFVNGKIFLQKHYVAILDAVSFEDIPDIWKDDIKTFMIGQAGPLLADGKLGIYSGDLNRWVIQNLDKILRHYKIEMIINE